MGESAVTERDVRVLLDLHRFRYLSTAQIERLHFPSRQTANRRLRALSESGFVKGYRGPATEDRIFYLTAKGLEVVEGASGDVEDGFQRVLSPAKDYYFLRHHLQINDFRIALEGEVAERDDIELLGFIPEYVGEKTKKSGVKKTIRDSVPDIYDPKRLLHHTPDGVFARRKEGRNALFFLEVDRGTEVLTDPEKGFLKALWFYYCCFASERHRRFLEIFRCEVFSGCRVLFVVPSAERLGNMRRAANRLPMAERRFVWLTTEDSGTAEVLSDIWLSLDETDANRYRIG